MQVTSEQVETKPAFVPIQLNLTFENRDELSKFYAIFNFVPICGFFDKEKALGGQIRRSLEKSYGRTPDNKDEQFEILKELLRKWAKE
jgi:hypothetical protein